MELSAARDIAEVPDLVHQVRRLHNFERHFRDVTRAIATRHRLALRIDGVRLTKAFLDWGEDFTRQRAAAEIDRRDYIIFTAGLLLRHLLTGAPLAVTPGAEIDPTDVVSFWPEGFLCTSYCVSVLDSVLQQEGLEAIHVSGTTDDAGIWWSFRENLAEDSWVAVGFLDLFVGLEPNWKTPGEAASRPALREASRGPLALH